jgi:DNA-binding HxlR family transcriptional regulator
MLKTNGNTNGKASAKTEDEPLSMTLSILNQRWTPHIIRCLLRRKMRFNEILRTIGMNPCTLRERLRELEHWGIVDRTVISQMPPCVEYRLTTKGKDLRPIFRSMENWTRKWLSDLTSSTPTDEG